MERPPTKKYPAAVGAGGGDGVGVGVGVGAGAGAGAGEGPGDGVGVGEGVGPGVGEGEGEGAGPEQGSTLHAREESGGATVQSALSTTLFSLSRHSTVLVCVPPPHATEQAPQFEAIQLYWSTDNPLTSGAEDVNSV